MMMVTLTKDTLLREAECAVLAALEDPAPRAADVLSQTIQQLVSTGDFSDSRLCYTLGYCWYHFPVEDEHRKTETEEWLRRSLALEPANQDARLYLGHYQFDEHRYGAARELLAAIPQGYFHGRHEDWQDLKREEWILCCDIFLTGQIDLERLRKLCRDYLLIPGDDAAVPLELIRTLAWAVRRPSAGAPLKPALREVCTLIHNLGLDEAFRQELADFTQRLAAE